MNEELKSSAVVGLVNRQCKTSGRGTRDTKTKTSKGHCNEKFLIGIKNPE